MGDIPHADARAIHMGLLQDWMQALRHAYFPDMSYYGAVEAAIILSGLGVAAAKGQPVNTYQLAKQLGISHQTLTRKLTLYERKGYVGRAGRTWRMGGPWLETPGAEQVHHDIRKLIIAAGEKLSKMENR